MSRLKLASVSVLEQVGVVCQNKWLQREKQKLVLEVDFLPNMVET